MGQATGYAALEVLDTVVSNALIVDYTGIYKVCTCIHTYIPTYLLPTYSSAFERPRSAVPTYLPTYLQADIGIKGGMIVGIGKAGNPDVMAGVSPNMIVGVSTDVICADGMIVTAGR